jgi:predicted flap endonuclease-1-like 5' DNA nuclease
MATCPSCGHLFDPQSLDTIWVDETLLALCNQAHALAKQQGDFEVRLTHLLFIIATEVQCQATLHRFGIVAEHVAQQLTTTFHHHHTPQHAPTRPRTSAELHALLARTKQSAVEHGHQLITVDDVLTMLISSGHDFEVAHLLNQSQGNPSYRTQSQWAQQSHQGDRFMVPTSANMQEFNRYSDAGTVASTRLPSRLTNIGTSHPSQSWSQTRGYQEPDPLAVRGGNSHGYQDLRAATQHRDRQRQDTSAGSRTADVGGAWRGQNQRHGAPHQHTATVSQQQQYASASNRATASGDSNAWQRDRDPRSSPYSHSRAGNTSAPYASNDRSQRQPNISLRGFGSPNDQRQHDSHNITRNDTGSRQYRNNRSGYNAHQSGNASDSRPRESAPSERDRSSQTSNANSMRGYDQGQRRDHERSGEANRNSRSRRHHSRSRNPWRKRVRVRRRTSRKRVSWGKRNWLGHRARQQHNGGDRPHNQNSTWKHRDRPDRERSPRPDRERANREWQNRENRDRRQRTAQVNDRPEYALRDRQQTADRETEARDNADDTPRFYLAIDDDIVDAPSIGPKTATRLNRVGLHTVRDLFDCDPDAIAQALNSRHITAARIITWQKQARLVCTIPGLRGTHAQLFVGAGLETPEDITARDANTVCSTVLRFAASKEGQNILRSGSPPPRDRILTWFENAGRAEPQRVA